MRAKVNYAFLIHPIVSSTDELASTWIHEKGEKVLGRKDANEKGKKEFGRKNVSEKGMNIIGR